MCFMSARMICYVCGACGMWRGGGVDCVEDGLVTSNVR